MKTPSTGGDAGRGTENGWQMPLPVLFSRLTDQAKTKGGEPAGSKTRLIPKAGEGRQARTALRVDRTLG